MPVVPVTTGGNAAARPALLLVLPAGAGGKVTSLWQLPGRGMDGAATASADSCGSNEVPLLAGLIQQAGGELSLAIWQLPLNVSRSITSVSSVMMNNHLHSRVRSRWLT